MAKRLSPREQDRKRSVRLSSRIGAYGGLALGIRPAERRAARYGRAARGGATAG